MILSIVIIAVVLVTTIIDIVLYKRVLKEQKYCDYMFAVLTERMNKHLLDDGEIKRELKVLALTDSVEKIKDNLQRYEQMDYIFRQTENRANKLEKWFYILLDDLGLELVGEKTLPLHIRKKPKK